MFGNPSRARIIADLSRAVPSIPSSRPTMRTSYPQQKNG